MKNRTFRFFPHLEQWNWIFDNCVKPSVPVTKRPINDSHTICASTYLFKILHGLYNQHQTCVYPHLSKVVFTKSKFQNLLRNRIVIECGVEKRVRCHFKLKMSIVVKILQFFCFLALNWNKNHFQQQQFTTFKNENKLKHVLDTISEQSGQASHEILYMW